MLLDLCVPSVTPAQLRLVEPYLDPSCPQGLANACGRLRILGRIREEYSATIDAHYGSVTSNLISASCSGANPCFCRNGSQRGSSWRSDNSGSKWKCTTPAS